MLHLQILDAAVAYTKLHEVAFVTAHAVVSGTTDTIALLAFGNEAHTLAAAAAGSSIDIDTDSTVQLASNEIGYLVNSASICN